MNIIKKIKNNHFVLIIILFVIFLTNCSKSGTNSEQEKVEIPKPSITSINPTKGIEGTAVTITGVNFSSDISTISVEFNNKVANEITFASKNQISTKVPFGAKTGPVSVSIGAETSTNSVNFIVEEAPLPPSITALSSVSELTEAIITITGTNFGNNISGISVSFNDIQANDIISVSETEIVVKVPVGASNGPVSVTKGLNTAIGPDFTVKTPINFKIAFLADSDIGVNADAVLNLIKNEGSQVVIHPGDLNYSEIPQDFENNINGILGAEFPYFYGVGNHDDTVWNGTNGYQSFLEARFQRLGIPWKGQLGVLSSFTYQGITFVSSAPDEFGITTTVAGNYIRDEFDGVNAIWRIAFWHKNQRLMQIGGKGNEAGWNVYEESRKAGAIIATGHEHSYSRTHEMSSFQNQTISSTDNTVNLIVDDPLTSIDEGRSFAFVSGIGGKSLRDAESGLENNPWWASVSHTGNGSQHGALFGEFNYNGDTTLAHFYFKDIDGKIVDDFFVRSND